MRKIIFNPLSHIIILTKCYAKYDDMMLAYMYGSVLQRIYATFFFLGATIKVN